MMPHPTPSRGGAPAIHAEAPMPTTLAPALAWALRQRVGGPGTRMVLIALAGHHDRDGAGCAPSIDDLADIAEVSVASVRRHLAGLRGLGLIHWEPAFGPDGAQGPNRYWLNLGGGAR